MNTRHALIDTAGVGELTVVASGDAISGIYFPGHWTLPDPASFGQRVELADDAVLSQAATELREYLAGDRMRFDVARAAHGSAFEKRLWSLLDEIPYGETTTYGELALPLGELSLARRVGQAVGRNPLSIVVPCHRVIGKGGELRGYAGGLVRKQFLLDHERRAGRGTLQLELAAAC